MDYLTVERPETDQLVNVLVVTDHFTRYTMAFITPDQKARATARVLWDGVFTVLGIPDKLLSDQGGSFENTLLKEICRLAGIRKSRTSPYRPQTNGQVERANQNIIRMLGKLDKEARRDWVRHLPTVIYAYNATRSRVTGYSPHYLMFGR